VNLVPMTIAQAELFLAEHKRHYKVEADPVFAIGLQEGIDARGAVIVGKKDGEAVIAHIYCDGVSEGYTKLYGAAVRAAKALGYTRMVL